MMRLGTRTGGAENPHERLGDLPRWGRQSDKMQVAVPVETLQRMTNDFHGRRKSQNPRP